MYKIIRFKIIYYLFFFIILTQYSYSQGIDQSWTKISFEKKISNFFEFEFSQGLRLKNQLTIFKLAFFESALSYRNSAGLKISIPYRYTIFQDEIRHRLSLEASYKYSFKSISLRYRIKYYRVYEYEQSIESDGDPFGDLVRNKFTIKYKIHKKINPYIYGELYHLYNANSDLFNEYRLSFGLEVDLPRKNSINFFYIFSKENIENSNTINIIGLSYTSKI